MHAPATFDAELLRRYDRPGPRYTSYPTAPQFRTDFDESRFRACVRRSNAEPIPRDLSLYVHIPFCFSPCFYCGCTRIVTRDRSRGALYLARLLREIEIVAPLFDRDRDVVQLHFGGGTPNFLEAGELAALLGSLGRHFHFSDRADRDFSIELDPRTLAPGEARRLAALGLNRASLGVQDFDPEVQRAVNRIQGVAQTLRVIEECRAGGMRSINVDLIYGLPKQTSAGFEATLDALLAGRPDRLAIYGYAHLPALFKAQRQIEVAELPDAVLRLELLRLAVRKLEQHGYRFIGMDHFALPGDDLSHAQAAGSLHRNFMGYTTHGESDLIGFGVSAISHVGESYSQNHRDLPGWEHAVDAGRLPVWRGLELDGDDLLRADVIQELMCRGEIDVAGIEERHCIDFRDYFTGSLAQLAPLAGDGLVTVAPGRIAATSRGRFLLRIIAMCFDRYLAESRAPRYSRAV
ncbi:MAG: oxygen-independent coproporphyrinogen III oxidase [Gammaproteobacteria bacterium]